MRRLALDLRDGRIGRGSVGRLGSRHGGLLVGGFWLDHGNRLCRRKGGVEDRGGLIGLRGLGKALLDVREELSEEVVCFVFILNPEEM